MSNELLRSSSNGWNEYSKLVLTELERGSTERQGLGTKQDTTNINLAQLRTDIMVEIAGLKVKSGVWGALAGAIPVILGLAIWFITKGA